jgi:lipid II:glycine glycyltransferase (peptidoglycan interpeptide bridge formation enzyme)
MAEVQAHTMTAEEIHQSPLVQDERSELVDRRRRHCTRYPVRATLYLCHTSESLNLNVGSKHSFRAVLSQKALFTTPPSTRSAAPVVAEASGLAR